MKATKIRHTGMLAIALLMVGCAERATPLAPEGEVQTRLAVARDEARPFLRAASRGGVKAAGFDRALVTPEHGGVLTARGVTLAIPAGAVTQPVVVRMIVPGGDYMQARFEPHGLQFEKQATLTFQVDASEVAEESLVGVYFGDSDVTFGGYVEAYETFEVRRERGSVSFDISHFSGYIVASG